MFFSLIIVSFLVYKLTFPCHGDTGPVSIVNDRIIHFIIIYCCINIIQWPTHYFGNFVNIELTKESMNGQHCC